MGRRRRSLLDSRGPSSGSSNDEYDDGVDAPLGTPRIDLPAPRPFNPAQGPTLVNFTPEPTPEYRDDARRKPEGEPASMPFAMYQQGHAQPVDAPVPTDLFGEIGFEGFEDAAPTEDVPAQVMEDVGQPYTTPFSVPEPPPLPGILDRFTPPPAQRTEIGSRRKKPDYLAETPEGKDRYQPTPAPSRRAPLGRPSTLQGDDDLDEFRQWPRGAMWVIAGGVMFGLLGLVSLVAATVLFFASGPGDPEVAEAADTIEIRDNLHQPVKAYEGTEPEPVVPEQGHPDDEPVPSKAVPSEPRPVKPPPKPAAEAPAPVKGKLKIRSNRWVLLYVNDQAIGYPPMDHDVAPGKYRVSAVIPGQPNTRQNRDVVVDEAGKTVGVEFSF